MGNFSVGILQSAYSMIMILKSSLGINDNNYAYLVAVTTVIVSVLTLVAVYLLLLFGLKKIYKQKNLSNVWQCYLPVVQFYGIIRVTEGTKFWGMSKKVISIIFFVSIGVTLACQIFIDYYYYGYILKYIFGGTISLGESHLDVTTLVSESILTGASYSNKDLLITFITSLEEISSIVATVFFVPILVGFFRTRTNKAWIFGFLSVLFIEAFAVLVLIVGTKKATPTMRIVFTNPYNNGGYNPYNNGGYNSYQQPQNQPVKEPFSEFNNSTKKQEPFGQFNSADYRETPDFSQEFKLSEEDEKPNNDTIFYNEKVEKTNDNITKDKKEEEDDLF